MKNIQAIKDFVEKYGGDAALVDIDGEYNGSLDFEGCTSLTSVTFPEGMAIGGYLDFRGCTSLTSVTFPEGMAIGGSLYFRGCTANVIGRVLENQPVNIPTALHWKWRDREYIKADGIFTRVISSRGNVYRVQRIGSTSVEYLVTDGAGKWAHGMTLDEARKDLVYKISNRDTSRYANLTLDDSLPHAEAIECYRVITGACALGTRNFVENILPADRVKESYKIREIIELTKGHYGASAFADFFNK